MLIFGWFYQTSEAFTPWMKPQGDTSVTDTRRTKFKVTRKTVADQGEPPPPPPPCPHIFRPKWGPKGPKYFFWDRAPPPYLRVWMTAPPPLSEGLDPALTLSLNFLHLIFFFKNVRGGGQWNFPWVIIGQEGSRVYVRAVLNWVVVLLLFTWIFSGVNFSIKIRAFQKFWHNGNLNV